MSTMTEFVKSLSDEEKIEIFEDYQKFCKEGSIGLCTLRVRAQEASKLLNNTAGIVRTMEWIAAEVHEEFATRYLKEKRTKWVQ